MAYFSNGTEGEMYREAYCDKCEFCPGPDELRERECPIWEAHWLYAYGAKDEVKAILDMLIPMEEHTFSDGITSPIAAKCAFWTRKQLDLPLKG